MITNIAISDRRRRGRGATNHGHGGVSVELDDRGGVVGAGRWWIGGEIGDRVRLASRISGVRGAARGRGRGRGICHGGIVVVILIIVRIGWGMRGRIRVRRVMGIVIFHFILVLFLIGRPETTI